MKLSFSSLILSALILFQGCNFEVNTGGIDKNDPIPESTFLLNGLKSDAVKMTVDGVPTMDNTFTFGTTVKFEFNNVVGLKRIKGLVYPGMSMRITDTGKDSTLFFEDDLLLKIDGGTDLKPLLLDAKFKTNVPHLNNEQYNIELKIWDKKGSGEMTFNLPFEVKASDLLAIDKNELDYTNIYFWDETDKKVVFGNEVNAENTFILINEGLEGFDVVDGMVYPGISLLLVDRNGNEIISDENLLSANSETGIDPIELRENQAPVQLTFAQGRTANPCHMTTRIFDLKNPEKHITIETDLVVN